MQQVFDKVKHFFDSTPTLFIPNGSDLFILETDASGHGIGAVLFQQGADTIQRPVGYFSKTLSDAERNYSIYKLELFAIVRAIKHFRIYLSHHPLLLRTDNQAILWWKRQVIPPGDVIARWFAFLEQFNFTVVHQKGENNNIADAISRNPDSVQMTNSSQTDLIPTDFLTDLIPTCYLTDFNRDLSELCTQEHKLIIQFLRVHTVDERQIQSGSLDLKELFANREKLCLQNGLIALKPLASESTSPTYIPSSLRKELLA